MARSQKSKRTVGIVVAIVIVLGIGVGFIVSQNRNGAYEPTTLANIKAKAPANPASCTAKTDNPSLQVPAGDQTDIMNAVSLSIIDVPAGTNFDIYIGTYDGSKATGSIVYDGTYGSYNFSATDTISDSGIWAVESFVACKS